MIIFADWYNTKVMEKIKFFDENSKLVYFSPLLHLFVITSLFHREWWTPETGGSNIPALNDLLSRWGLELADTIIEGNATIGEEMGIRYGYSIPFSGDLHSSIKSGTVISRAPAGTHLSYATVNDIVSISPSSPFSFNSIDSDG